MPLFRFVSQALVSTASSEVQSGASSWVNTCNDAVYASLPTWAPETNAGYLCCTLAICKLSPCYLQAMYKLLFCNACQTNLNWSAKNPFSAAGLKWVSGWFLKLLQQKNNVNAAMHLTSPYTVQRFPVAKQCPFSAFQIFQPWAMPHQMSLQNHVLIPAGRKTVRNPPFRADMDRHINNHQHLSTNSKNFDVELIWKSYAKLAWSNPTISCEFYQQTTVLFNGFDMQLKTMMTMGTRRPSRHGTNPVLSFHKKEKARSYFCMTAGVNTTSRQHEENTQNAHAASK